MAQIFISYSRTDEDFARRIAASLSDLSADIWIDVEDIPAGMKWSTAIQQGLDICDAMLVVISPDSIASTNVEDEWQYYLDKGKLVIPLLWLPAEVHFQLNRLQYVDFHAQEYETALKQLHGELKRHGIALDPISSVIDLSDSTAHIPHQRPLPVREGSSRGYLPFALGGLALILIVGAVLLFSGVLGGDEVGDSPTEVVEVATETATNTPPPSHTPTSTPTLTETHIPTETATPTITPNFTETVHNEATQTAIKGATQTTQAQTDFFATQRAITPTVASTPFGGGSGQLIFTSDQSDESFTDQSEIVLLDIASGTFEFLTNNNSIDGAASWSWDGSRIVFLSDRDGSWEIYTMGADGSDVERLTRNEEIDMDPAWSPDGLRIAFSGERHGDLDIYVMDADGSNVQQLTHDSAIDRYAVWSPDGSQIAFASNRAGNGDIYVMDSDGSNVRQLTQDESQEWSPAWSPDGSQVAFSSDRDVDFDIYVMNDDGSNVRQLTLTLINEFNPSWSPDGSRIAFSTNRDWPYFDIYVMDTNGDNSRRLTETETYEFYPSWRP